MCVWVFRGFYECVVVFGGWGVGGWGAYQLHCRIPVPTDGQYTVKSQSSRHINRLGVHIHRDPTHDPKQHKTAYTDIH